MMLRKLVVMAVALGMMAFSASTAWSAAFIPGGSSLSAKLANLPEISVSGDTTKLTAVSLGGGALSIDAGLFATSGLTVGTTLLTNVALMQNLTLNVQNNAGSLNTGFSATPSSTVPGGYTPGNPWGGGLTGAGALSGSASLCGGGSGCLGGRDYTLNGAIVIAAAGGLALPFPLDAVGRGGTGSTTLGGAPIAAIGGPWITGKARVTGLNTNVLFVPGRGGQVGVGVTLNLATTETATNVTTMGGLASTVTATAPVLATEGTVTFTGTNSITASGVGTVTLISPTKIDTGALALGNLPGVWRTTFKFVPEPGTVLLLVSGAAGLAFIGRKRMKS